MQSSTGLLLHSVALLYPFIVGAAHTATAQTGQTLPPVSGVCDASSFIAEGPVGSDLTKQRSRFFCDSVVITFFDDAKGHIMLQFSQKNANGFRILGFAGHADAKDEGQIDRKIVLLDTFYFTQDIGTPINHGSCTLFITNHEISKLFCSAIVDKGSQRTAAVVTFTPNPDETSAPSGTDKASAIAAAPQNPSVTLENGEQWQKIVTNGGTLYVQINGRFFISKPPLYTPENNSRYGFVTNVVTDLPESDIVGAPESVLKQVEGNCDIRQYSVLGTIYYGGKARSGFPSEPLPAENVVKKVIPGSGFEQAFDVLCKIAYGN